MSEFEEKLGKDEEVNSSDDERREGAGANLDISDLRNAVVAQAEGSLDLSTFLPSVGLRDESLEEGLQRMQATYEEAFNALVARRHEFSPQVARWMVRQQNSYRRGVQWRFGSDFTDEFGDVAPSSVKPSFLVMIPPDPSSGQQIGADFADTYNACFIRGFDCSKTMAGLIMWNMLAILDAGRDERQDVRDCVLVGMMQETGLALELGGDGLMMSHNAMIKRKHFRTMVDGVRWLVSAEGKQYLVSVEALIFGDDRARSYNERGLRGGLIGNTFLMALIRAFAETPEYMAYGGTVDTCFEKLLDIMYGNNL